MAATHRVRGLVHIGRPWVVQTARPQVVHIGRPRVVQITRPSLVQYSPAGDISLIGTVPAVWLAYPTLVWTVAQMQIAFCSQRLIEERLDRSSELVKQIIQRIFFLFACAEQ